MKHSILKVAGMAAFAGLAAPLQAAAQQPAAPPVFAGAYTLAQVDSADLPILITEAEGCRKEVTAATLTLQPDNTWKLEANVRNTCGDQVEEKTAIEEGNYTATGMDLTFTANEQGADEPEDVDIEKITSANFAENVLTVKLQDEKVLTFRK